MTAVAKRKLLEQKIRDWEKPVEFVENFKYPGTNKSVTFDAGSYTSWMESVLPVIRTMIPCFPADAKQNGTRVGDNIFYLRPLLMMDWHSPSFFFEPRPTRCGLQIYRGKQHGMAYFTEVVNIPVLANNIMSPLMSLTPNEVITLRGSVRRAKNNVAIAGLGLGLAARKVLERKQVKHLTVYEKDQNIIDFFGESLRIDFKGRITIECANAYEVNWAPFDISLWDIWSGWGDASDDRRFWKIKDEMERKGNVFIGWGQGVHERY
jgi:hypothetical protein